MQFKIVTILGLAALGHALPQSYNGTSPSKGMTVGSAMKICGTFLDLSCCEKADTSEKSTSTAHGLLSDLLGGGLLKSLLSHGSPSLFHGCSAGGFQKGIFFHYQSFPSA
jgi:hypothetical protein